MLCVSQQLKIKAYPNICVPVKLFGEESGTCGVGTSAHMEISLARWKSLPLALLQGTFSLYLCFEDCHGDSHMGTFSLIWGCLGASEHVGDINKQTENRILFP